jgi:hypothetical protein
MKPTAAGGWEKFWIVHDPASPKSEVGDICFETHLAGLAACVRGGFDPEQRHTNAVLYTDAALARADAEARIRARRVYDAELRAAREGGVVKFDDGGCPVVIHRDDAPRS